MSECDCVSDHTGETIKADADAGAEAHAAAIAAADEAAAAAGEAKEGEEEAEVPAEEAASRVAATKLAALKAHAAAQQEGLAGYCKLRMPLSSPPFAGAASAEDPVPAALTAALKVFGAVDAAAAALAWTVRPPAPGLPRTRQSTPRQSDFSTHVNS